MRTEKIVKGGSFITLPSNYYALIILFCSAKKCFFVTKFYNCFILSLQQNSLVMWFMVLLQKHSFKKFSFKNPHTVLRTLVLEKNKKIRFRRDPSRSYLFIVSSIFIKDGFRCRCSEPLPWINPFQKQTQN